jgi:hypothetical protein
MPVKATGRPIGLRYFADLPFLVGIGLLKFSDHTLGL